MNTYMRGHRLIDEVAGWDELQRAIERADPETRRGVIARALEDLLTTDDAAIVEHIHSALFATVLRQQLPMPADWERDDPRFVKFAELWLCVHAPVVDADQLDRTLAGALDGTWEPMLDDDIGASPEQKFGKLLYELVCRLIREPQAGTATVLRLLAERAPSMYKYPTENAANRAPAGPRRGRVRAPRAIAIVWARLAKSIHRKPTDSPPHDSAVGASSDGGPYRASGSGAAVERPPLTGPSAWSKLEGVLAVGERGVLRALRADPGSLLDRWDAIAAHATPPPAGCYCTQPRPDRDAIRDAPCGMRTLRTLDEGPGTAVVLECPHTRLRWIRHEVPEMPDGTYGRHRRLPAQVEVRVTDSERFLELAYVVKGWIERPAARVVSLVESWRRAGRPAAELPTDVDE